MIPITSSLSIPDSAVKEHFVRAPGPGGQNVNKSATAVQLRFDAKNCEAIDAETFNRLRQLAGHRMTRDGEIVIQAHRYRSQDDNRRDARERLIRLLRQAATRPKRRKRTRPGRAARERRLQSKKIRAGKKALRKSPRVE